MILLGYLNFARMGSVGARASLDFLMGQIGFWAGALLLGLLIPFGLEIFALVRRGRNPRLDTLLSITSGMLVIAGVFLLRYYVVHAGVFEFPW